MNVLWIVVVLALSTIVCIGAYRGLVYEKGWWATGASISTLLISGLFGSSVHCSCNPGEGISAGTVINVGKSGVVFQRPVVYLLHAGEINGEPFGVDPSLLSDFEHYAATGERVEVKYETRMWVWTWEQASSDIITGVKPAPATTTRPEAGGN